MAKPDDDDLDLFDPFGWSDNDEQDDEVDEIDDIEQLYDYDDYYDYDDFVEYEYHGTGDTGGKT